MTMEKMQCSANRYAIALGKELASTERAAAEDLAHYIGRMVGMRPRMYRGIGDLSDVQEDAVFAIGTPASNALLGRLAETGDASLSVEGLGTEGLAVHSAKLDGKPVVALAGESPVGAMYAASTYLERNCGVGFFNDGDRVPQRWSLPVSGLSYAEKPHFEQRVWFHHAVWTRPYDRCFQLWGFEDWKKLIDWMRRKKLNQLLLFHDEGTFLWGDAVFRAFPKIPKNGETLQHFTMLPEYRTELNQRVFRYARENGVYIGYNLFYSQVPDFFSEYYPDLRYHQLQMGNLGICAATPECQQFMLRFWEEIIDLYGTDEMHAYHVCPYQHEARLCEHFETRAEPTRQAYEVLKAIDPQAKMYVETWCWYYGHEPGKNPQQALREWDELQQIVPPEVGVHDWDRVARPWKPRMRPGGEAFGWYKPREWISLHHLTMEWAWPPDYGWHPLEKSVKAVRVGAENDAVGIAAFHILARTNELPAYVFAEMAWSPEQTQREMVRNYLRLRFRPESVDVLEKSFEAHFEAATSDACLFGARGLSVFPTEMELVDRICTGGRAATGSWAAEKLKDFRYRYAKTKEALTLGQSVAWNEQGNPFFDRYMWELTYLMNRWYGIIEFYRAYRSSVSSVAASEHFQHALHAFYRIRAMFHNEKGVKMEALQELAPEVKYNPSFLGNWRITIGREFDDHRVRHHNVVWELFPEYEARLLSMDPTYVEKKD